MSAVETREQLVPRSPWATTIREETQLVKVAELASLVTAASDSGLYDQLQALAAVKLRDSRERGRVKVEWQGAEYVRLPMRREDQRDFNLPRYRYVVSFGRLVPLPWTQLVMTVRHRDAQRVGRVSKIGWGTWEKNFGYPTSWVYLPLEATPEEVRRADA